MRCPTGVSKEGDRRHGGQTHNSAVRHGMWPLILCLGAVAIPACAKEDPFASAPAITGPVASAQGLVYTDHDGGELMLVNPNVDVALGLDVTRVPVSDEQTRIEWVQPTLDGSGIMALVGPASEKQEDIQEALHLVSADGASEPAVVDVLAPFNGVALSPDLRRAVLYFAQDASTFLQNANQVAIVDLDGSGARNLTLDGFGGRLASVHFPAQTERGIPNPVSIGGTERDIAAFLARGEVVLVDMDDPTADQVAVRFDDLGAFVPQASLLRPGDGRYQDPALFLRSGSGTDVVMLSLRPKSDEITGAAGFTANVALISVGGATLDFVCHDDGDTPYLIALADRRLEFVDIRTHGHFPVELEEQGNRLFLRDAITEDGAVQQAVVWAPGARRIQTLMLDRLDTSVGRRPEFLAIETGIGDLVQLDNDRALVGSGNFLYVVDFTRSQVTPLTAQVPYDPSSAVLDGNLLLLGQPGQERISAVDLTILNPETMLLDDPIGSFHYLPGIQKVVSVHGDPLGHLTISEATGPSRGTSRSFWGYLATDFLDRG